jgi:hypothetical protein
VRASERCACATFGYARDNDRQVKRSSGLRRPGPRIGANVGAVESGVDEVRAFGLLGTHDARGQHGSTRRAGFGDFPRRLAPGERRNAGCTEQRENLPAREQAADLGVVAIHGSSWPSFLIVLKLWIACKAKA